MRPLRFDRENSLRSLCYAAAFSVAIGLAGWMFRGFHLASSIPPFAKESPLLWKVLGFCEFAAALTAGGLWMRTVYNGILEKTPDATDGDPIHMREPIEWRKIGFATLVIALVALAFFAFAKP